jgi:hypothetical protein
MVPQLLDVEWPPELAEVDVAYASEALPRPSRVRDASYDLSKGLMHFD